MTLIFHAPRHHKLELADGRLIGGGEKFEPADEEQRARLLADVNIDIEEVGADEHADPEPEPEERPLEQRNRRDLDALADSLGVPAPAALPNRRAVIDRIREAQSAAPGATAHEETPSEPETEPEPQAEPETAEEAAPEDDAADEPEPDEAEADDNDEKED